MTIIKTIISTIGFIYMLNMSMTSIFPIILFVIFFSIYSNYEGKKNNKVILFSCAFTLLYLLFNLNKNVSLFRLLFIILAIFFVVELLLNTIVEKIGDKNV